jgi:hypothetical protein
MFEPREAQYDKTLPQELLKHSSKLRDLNLK